MSNTDGHDPPPSRLADSDDAFERLLARSAKLDDEDVQRRHALRGVTTIRASRALSRSPNWLALAAGGLAVAAAVALAIALTRVAPHDDRQVAAESLTHSRPTAMVPRPTPVPIELEPCPAVIVASGSTPLIDDFEDRNARLLLQDGRSGSWLANGDAKSKQKPRAGTTAFPSAIPKGREHSRYALHFFGVQLGASAGLGATLAPGHCYDASKYGGVELWAKGPGRLYVMTSMIDALERKWGGLCDSGCYDPHRAALDLSGEWQHFTVRWSELRQVGYGKPMQLDEKRLYSLEFLVETADSPFDLWIDDVGFLAR